MRATRLLGVLAVSLGVLGTARQADVPLGLEPYMRVPADNPLTAPRIRLGRRLFFDTRLSGDGTLSCATCHRPDRAFADDRPVSVGIGGRQGARNVPPLINRGYGLTFFWDGRADSLEAQVLQPVTNPIELGSSIDTMLERLRSDPSYVTAFEEAFAAPVTADDVARALAGYVRSIRSGGSPVDRFRAGDREALTPQERFGMQVFGSQGLCTTCHAGSTLTDERFHNTGIAWDPRARTFRDAGRFAVTGRAADRGAFRTPTLRDVSKTAPYMHDGSLERLEDVVEFYDGGGRPNPNLDTEILPLGLAIDEKRALLAFLRALDGTLVEGR